MMKRGRAHDAADTLAEEIVASGRTDFSEAQAQALKEIAEAYLGLKAFGRLANAMKSIAVWLGWAGVTYLAIKAGAIDFIRGVRP